jgi:hypothetical protein
MESRRSSVWKLNISPTDRVSKKRVKEELGVIVVVDPKFIGKRCDRWIYDGLRYVRPACDLADADDALGRCTRYQKVCRCDQYQGAKPRFRVAFNGLLQRRFVLGNQDHHGALGPWQAGAGGVGGLLIPLCRKCPSR